MKKLTLLSMLIGANAVASSDLNFYRIATARSGDPKNTSGFQAVGSPSINSQGNVLFWAKTSGGENFFTSSYDASSDQYGTAQAVLGVGTYSNASDIVKDVSLNDRGEFAYATGDGLPTDNLTISGCGLPLPPAMAKVRNLKILKPLTPISKKIFQPKLFTPLVPGYNATTWKNGRRVAGPGTVVCPKPIVDGIFTYKFRITLLGGGGPTLTNSGEVSFASIFYKEIFTYASTSPTPDPVQYGAGNGQGIFSFNGSQSDLRIGMPTFTTADIQISTSGR